MSDIDPNEDPNIDNSDGELNNTFDSNYDQEDDLDQSPQKNQMLNESGEIEEASASKKDAEQPIKLTLFTRQQVIKNISTMFPDDVQEMISSDMQKFSDMLTNFNLRFDATEESSEKLTILTQANYMSNILLNMYPFSINEPCVRTLMLNNFRVMIDEKIPINT